MLCAGGALRPGLGIPQASREMGRRADAHAIDPRKRRTRAKDVRPTGARPTNLLSEFLSGQTRNSSPPAPNTNLPLKPKTKLDPQAKNKTPTQA